MQADVRTGPVITADGSIVPVRGGKSGEAMVADAHARYQEAVYRGNVFFASNQAGVALSLLNATATGFVLSNPAGSGKYLSILEIAVALTSAPAGVASLMLAANVNPVAAAVVHTTPLVVRNAILGAGGTPVGLVDSAATLPATPVVVRAIGGGPVATGSINAPFIKDEVAGALLIAPGASVSMSALTTAISAITSMTWEEIPV